MRRRLAPGEARDGKVEAAPPEVHRAGLPDEAAPELVQHPIHVDQHAPQSVGGIGIVGCVRLILIERDYVLHLVGKTRDARVYSQVPQRCHDFAMEVGDRPRS